MRDRWRRRMRGAHATCWFDFCPVIVSLICSGHENEIDTLRYVEAPVTVQSAGMDEGESLFWHRSVYLDADSEYDFGRVIALRQSLWCVFCGVTAVCGNETNFLQQFVMETQSVTCTFVAKELVASKMRNEMFSCTSRKQTNARFQILTLVDFMIFIKTTTKLKKNKFHFLNHMIRSLQIILGCRLTFSWRYSITHTQQYSRVKPLQWERSSLQDCGSLAFFNRQNIAKLACCGPVK